MRKLVFCICAALTAFVSSCAPTGPERPADQAAKMRLHRTAPSEDIEETDRAKQGSPLPPVSASTWNF